MVTALPYVCVELDPIIPARTREIGAKLKSGIRQSQAQAAAETLALAINILVDRFLSQLLRDLAEAYPTYRGYKKALAIVDEVKDKALQYLNWLTRFLSNERMAVVVDKYLAMIQPLIPAQPEREFLTVGLDPVMAAHARRTINALRSGESKDVSQAIEVLIDIIEALLVDFVYEPKRLMHFNLVVNKTLDGIIHMIKGLSFRQLRALGSTLPLQHLPVFLDHIEHVFHDTHPVGTRL